MSRKQGRESPVTARRERLGIRCSLDDTVRAEAVSLQVKPLLKTAVESGLAKQKDIQMEQAGHLLPVPRAQELSASSHPNGAILGCLTFLICASQEEPA